MGSLNVSTPFQVLDNPRPDDMSLPAFMVSKHRGFLPRMDPIVTLPSDFDIVESILQRMPVKTADGTPGLLAEGKLGDVIDAELPDLTDSVDKHKANLPLMNALYRDYSFLASAYLLEPCHQRFLRGEPYGLGRQVLPANLARPIARCAELCEFKPFMEYAGSYALFNYRLLDPTLPPTPSNLTLIRAFEHGLDPSSSEAGFVLVHIDMALNSGPLVTSALSILDSVAANSRWEFNTSMTDLVATLKKINASMETMWARSRPTKYTSFRTFIFGITAQSMFPNGVVYEGVGPDPSKPLSFRGESGANDSMIPLVDNLVGVPMPDTPLTKILLDFRTYRPSNHREFLGCVKGRAEGLGVKQWALYGGDGEEGMKESRGLWLKVLNEVRDFRWRHWCFAREYILKRTSHPTATGGSPIVTWLPNQLQAVLDEMVRLYEGFGGEEGGLGEEVGDIMDLVKRQQETLRKEVGKFCEERGPAATTVSS
ncbi:indoleamine 2,3-dioxygenase gamma type [Podospora aff. communis PSN243]|uniref:Indoleamine 2,3-dioxygenase gamma type n=1 Tax=Podospora aff. communis PSN243 TaxID=3040156 RepID=A0AAV9H0F9_9PEZI|nr:indoleamine 2,3-dioxygenase gamma type [Podospora aff. communis PSN243]